LEGNEKLEKGSMILEEANKLAFDSLLNYQDEAQAKLDKLAAEKKAEASILIKAGIEALNKADAVCEGEMKTQLENIKKFFDIERLQLIIDVK